MHNMSIYSLYVYQNNDGYIFEKAWISFLKLNFKSLQHIRPVVHVFISNKKTIRIFSLLF